MLMTVQIVPAPPMFCIYSLGLTCTRYTYLCTYCAHPPTCAHRHHCVNNPNWRTESRTRHEHVARSHGWREKEKENGRIPLFSSPPWVLWTKPVYRLWRNFLLRGLYRFVNYAAGIRCRIPNQVELTRERVTKSTLFAGQAILITLKLIPLVGFCEIKENIKWRVIDLHRHSVLVKRLYKIF